MNRRIAGCILLAIGVGAYVVQSGVAVIAEAPPARHPAGLFLATTLLPCGWMIATGLVKITMIADRHTVIPQALALALWIGTIILTAVDHNLNGHAIYQWTILQEFAFLLLWGGMWFADLVDLVIQSEN